MKTSSATGPRAPKRSTAANCLLINQFATPGLGSLMAGQRLAGAIELTLAVAGFCLFVAWFVQICFKTYRLTVDLPPEPERYPWLGKAGVILFATAWLLSWVTSIRIVIQARRAHAAEMQSGPPPLPPRIQP